jgi:endo-1,4-beta-xylanase
MKPFRALYFALLSLAPLLLTPSASAADQPYPEIVLWKNGAPGSEGKTAPEKLEAPIPSRDYARLTSIHKPSITVYLPPKEKATGAAVIVAPGGGHSFLAVDIEGYNVGQWLSEHGVAAFVLKYRLAKESNSTYTVEGNEVPDAQRAIRLVRSRAEEWNVNPDRIGIMGFSAGGEVAFRTAQTNGDAFASDSDPIDKLSSRPNFQALIYPGNLRALEVTSNSPPAFLACGANDGTIATMLPNAYLKFKEAKVPVELHIYSGVGHGFGIRPQNHKPVDQWPQRFAEWLDVMGFLKKEPKANP